MRQGRRRAGGDHPDQHPRFLFVALPFVFVLMAAGVVWLLQLAWSRGATVAGPVPERA